MPTNRLQNRRLAIGGNAHGTPQVGNGWGGIVYDVLNRAIRTELRHGQALQLRPLRADERAKHQNDWVHGRHRETL